MGRRRHKPFVIADGNVTAIVHGDPKMANETRAALLRVAREAYELLKHAPRHRKRKVKR